MTKLQKYEGSELIWSTDDVYMRAEGLNLTHDEAVEILHNAFEGNQYLMEKIGEAIHDAIWDFKKAKQDG